MKGEGNSCKEVVMSFEGLVSQWTMLAGFAALIAVAINVGKAVGVVKDGWAPVWSVGLNLVGLVGLFVLQVVDPTVDVAEMDTQAAQFAEVATVVLSYIVQLLSSKLAHYALKGVPWFGESFSAKSPDMARPF